MTGSPLVCHRPACRGTADDDGYCQNCGTKARPPGLGDGERSASTSTANPTTSQSSSFTGPRGTLVTGSGRAGGARRRMRQGPGTTTRTSLGAGLVSVPSIPPVDPSAAVLVNPVLAERMRFCGSCCGPVGRAHGTAPGRLSGFCPSCGKRFDFRPKLPGGEVLGGQYEIVGCLAHGGLGWIYLGRDKAVNDQWVVLKGLLNVEDDAATAVAVAEKRFLAECQHGNIVKILNFVVHHGAGYIVMEYVGGPSLKEILRRRRDANGRPDPLPVDQAIAYILGALPAFAYLHSRALVYCDFKPENLIQIGDQVKLVDLGAVRRLDDLTGDVYGTVGFQAPEVAEMGPSVASDVYTLGRTLAVLTLDFKGFQTAYQSSLPDPADHPALARFDSFHRFLLKATAPHPDDRFQSVAEMDDQLLSVLREVVALTTGGPRPAPSSVFGPPSRDHELPALAADPADPAAAFLATLTSDGPDVVREEIGAGLAAGQVTETVEVRLRWATALIEGGDHDAAEKHLDKIEGDDPWEWRAVWLKGLSGLLQNELAVAVAAFDRCRSEVPGELAPKLAAAVASERSGALTEAAALYDVVVGVDPSYVEAARGLARVRAATGDVAGALRAYDRIPPTHRAYAAAQLDAVRMLVAARRLSEATLRLKELEVDPRTRAELDVTLLEAALEALLTGELPQSVAAVGGHVADERNLRLGLADALRRLAAATSEPGIRRLIVDQANRVRPVTLL